MGMIQIRNVPDDVHRKLKTKAAAAGMSLSDYLLDEVSQLSETVSWAEALERMASLSPPPPPPSGPTAAEIIRDMRGL